MAEDNNKNTIGLSDDEFDKMMNEGYFFQKPPPAATAESQKMVPANSPEGKRMVAETWQEAPRIYIPPKPTPAPSGALGYGDNLNARGGFGSASRSQVSQSSAPTTNIPQNNPVENVQQSASYSKRVSDTPQNISPVDNPRPVSDTGPRGPRGQDGERGPASPGPMVPANSPEGRRMVNEYFQHQRDLAWSKYRKEQLEKERLLYAPSLPTAPVSQKPTNPNLGNVITNPEARDAMEFHSGNLDHLRPRPHWYTGKMEVPYFNWPNTYPNTLPGKILEYIPTSKNNIPPGIKPGQYAEIDDRYKAPLSVRVQRGEVSTLLNYPLMKPNSNDSLPSYITQSAIAGAWNSAVLTGGAAQNLIGGVVGLPFNLLGLTGKPKPSIQDPQPIPPVPRRPFNFADDDL